MDGHHHLQHLGDAGGGARGLGLHRGHLAEYYRQMGLNVLLLADSTSRWARRCEVSGRLEEIPCEEAFPAYLESRIASFYERAGAVELKDGRVASLTIGGTVSPRAATEEPVTQGTLKVWGPFTPVAARSDARRYPSIDRSTLEQVHRHHRPDEGGQGPQRAPPRQ
jgi:vacuolar-type H+-ATPase catalytic subunit A/Vma1